MWVTKLLISPVKKWIFCPKTTKFGPKLAFLVNLGQAMQAYSMPCWWDVWWLWRAGCISQDTYLLYKYRGIISEKVKTCPVSLVKCFTPYRYPKSQYRTESRMQRMGLYNVCLMILEYKSLQDIFLFLFTKITCLPPGVLLKMRLNIHMQQKQD